MGELKERECFLGGKVKCITRGQPIGWHYPVALHRLHSAPPAEPYLAPFIMHGHHPSTHRPVMARSLRQLCPTPLFPLRGCERLHNLEAARCFLGSSLIKNVTDWVSGGVLSKGGHGGCSTSDNGPKTFSSETFLKHGDVSITYGWLPTCIQDRNLHTGWRTDVQIHLGRLTRESHL